MRREDLEWSFPDLVVLIYCFDFKWMNMCREALEWSFPDLVVLTYCFDILFWFQVSEHASGRFWMIFRGRSYFRMRFWSFCFGFKWVELPMKGIVRKVAVDSYLCEKVFERHFSEKAFERYFSGKAFERYFWKKVFERYFWKKAFERYFWKKVFGRHFSEKAFERYLKDIGMCF